jgi:hypothetical protein
MIQFSDPAVRSGAVNVRPVAEQWGFGGEVPEINTIPSSQVHRPAPCNPMRRAPQEAHHQPLAAIDPEQPSFDQPVAELWGFGGEAPEMKIIPSRAEGGRGMGLKL